MRRHLIIASVLCLAAILLNLDLTEVRTKIIATHPDYSTTTNIESDPILTTYTSVADLFCAGQNPCKNEAIARIVGFYAREGVPKLIATIGGLAIPLVLLVSALYFAITMLPKWGRLSVACVLILLSAVVLIWVTLDAYVVDIKLTDIMHDGDAMQSLFIDVAALLIVGVGIRLLWTPRTIP